MNTKKKISMAALMAILAAAGYGGYTIVKEKDLQAMRSGGVATYKVERVIDGDTFELKDKDVVRLVGIDAPEVGECYFDESKDALKKLVEGKDVELRKDITNMDDFGRLLRYALVQNEKEVGTNVLAEEYMVENGFADTMTSSRDKLFQGLLVQARENAMKDKKGMWSACAYDPAEHSQNDSKPTNAKCTIKGNVTVDSIHKVYFVPGCNNYAQVKIDPDRGEKYFCSEVEAKAAGFSKAQYCP